MSVLTTSPANVLSEKLRRQFIPFLRNALHFSDFATPGSQPKGGGAISLRWMIFDKITQDETGGLTQADATDGEITTLTVTTVSTTVAEYGAWVKISSLADLAHTPETRAQYAEGLGEHGARTLDSLLRVVCEQSADPTLFLVSGQAATGTGTLTVTDTAQAQDIAVISGRFNQNDCKPVLNGLYVCIVHGAVEQDIVTDVTTGRLSWSEINKYVPGLDGQKKIIEGSPGAVYGTMILRSNNIATTVLTNTRTAYMNIALSKDALGRASFDAMTPAGATAKGPALMTRQSGPQDTSNPLGMFATIGWKFNSGQALLDANRVIVFFSAI